MNTTFLNHGGVDGNSQIKVRSSCNMVLKGDINLCRPGGRFLYSAL